MWKGEECESQLTMLMMGQTSIVVRGKMANMSPMTVSLAPVNFFASWGKKGATTDTRTFITKPTRIHATKISRRLVPDVGESIGFMPRPTRSGSEKDDRLRTG